MDSHSLTCNNGGGNGAGSSNGCFDGHCTVSQSLPMNGVGASGVDGGAMVGACTGELGLEGSRWAMAMLQAWLLSL